MARTAYERWEEHIEGLENKYEKAMEKLDKYYEDTHKVVQVCTA